MKTPDLDVRFRVSPFAAIYEEEREGKRLAGDERRARRDARTPAYADLVRIKSPQGGSVAGVTVGTGEREALAALGEPESRTSDADGAVLSYLDHGATVRLQEGKVTELALHRPRQLLEAGTTAFAPRASARIFVERFESPENARMRDPAQLERWLADTGILQPVAKREDADFVLSCQLTRLTAERQPLGRTLPLKVVCRGELTFDLEDVANPANSIRGEQIPADTRIDWTGKVGLSALALAALESSRIGEVPKVVLGLLGAAGYASLQSSANRAAERLPQVIERHLYDRLAQRLYDRVDLESRALEIDYVRSRITVPWGRRDGVRDGNGGATPTTFDVSVGGQPLPGSDEGLTADFYVAEVAEAGETSSKCRLVRVQRRVKRGKMEMEPPAEAPYLLARIPQAATGIVSVRMRPAVLLSE
jgi:hypothetical protein